MPGGADRDAHPQRARARGVGGELTGSPLRLLCWKLFLGVLSPTTPAREWPEQMARHRALYTELQQTCAAAAAPPSRA